MSRRRPLPLLTVLMLAFAPALPGCDEAPPEPAAKPPALTQPAKQHAERSAKVMFRQHCASCHSPTGDGNGIASSMLVRQPKNWTLPGALEGWGDAALAERIEKGVPGEGNRPAPMPAFESAFTPQEVKALVDYVRELAGEPAKP